MKGYIQSQRVYYDLTHAPVSFMSTLLDLLSLSVKLKLRINQMDVTPAFLNAVFDYSVYFHPPPPFYHLIPIYNSLKFFKSLYGLKQAASMWNQLLYN